MTRGNQPGQGAGRPARRRKIATRQIRHVYGQGAAAEIPPSGLPPLRFPPGIHQLAAADFCGSVTFNGYYGDPPAE